VAGQTVPDDPVDLVSSDKVRQPLVFIWRYLDSDNPLANRAAGDAGV